MENLKNILFWRQTYGLLPLHLKKANEERFLMLNGGYGDFCLQTFEGGDSDLFKEYSWSSNTKNYLVVNDENILIVNWLENRSELVSMNAVEQNLSKFYKYLLSKSYRTHNDAVPFIIDIFRQLRNETTEKQNPSKALSVLFQLLISIENNDLNRISNKFLDFEKAVLPSNFEYYRSKLCSGVKSIRPNLDLILRHSSGILFQEAHKEVVYFDLQRDLFGGVSSTLTTKKDSYSSIHYTPPYLARSIVENTLKEINLSKEHLKILDPSCGSSEFLIEVLKQLKYLKYNGKITILGYDSSISAIETSKFLLHYENQTQWNGELVFDIKHVEDSLSTDWGNNNDLILMNPPFVSWEQLKNKDSRDLVKTVLGDSFIKGKPNQASAFFYKATESLNENGVLGCVLPSSIFTFDSYFKIRNETKEKIDLILLGKLGNFVFEDALTDISIFIGKKPHGSTYPKVLWTKNEKGIVSEALRELRKLQINNEIAKIDSNYNIFTPTIFPFFKDNWKLISNKEELFIRELEIYVTDNKLTRLAEVFSVKQGLRQGYRDVFKIPKSEYKLEENKELFRPVVDNSAIKNGVLKDISYIWYPYNKEGSIFKNELELENINFFTQKIKPLEKILKSRAGISEWWGHTRPRNWQFEQGIKLVSTEFGSSNSFAFDKTGKFVVERGNAWIPKKKFELDYYYFYLAIFSSSVFNDLLTIYSKPILSGFYLGQVYTKEIPIPDVTILEKGNSNYLKLVLLGKELETGNSSALYSINEEVKRFYPKL
ncbi:N-6 DNA methylase [Cognataquiflexum rubidum]|uniref:N-6 DNA methylase n=1 Tax=Cognataquiflexum rubidum TaxID=2922273 RepID=UPI001F13A52E|nr:N-6 DNA methylase [Cognataquiflexum rubidum]MCH6234707.1 N-6 DNA methylase [Cognataquiflexum rubidum]